MKKEKNELLGSQELRKRLPRGAIKALATKYNYSLVWITRVVTGEGKGDPRILADAMHLASVEDIKQAAMKEIMNVETTESVETL